MSRGAECKLAGMLPDSSWCRDLRGRGRHARNSAVRLVRFNALDLFLPQLTTDSSLVQHTHYRAVRYHFCLRVQRVRDVTQDRLPSRDA